MQIQRLSIAFKALRQLGFSQVALNLLYKFGLATGHYRRATHSPIAQQLIGLHLKLLAPLPTREQLISSLGENGLQNLLAEAGEILDDKFRLFGGDPVPLELIPPGPLAHWTYYESGKIKLPATISDIKNLWEPARFGWAFVLGRAYHISGHEAYAAAFWRLFEIFNSTNPPYLGPNWMSGQEVGLRLIAFVWAAQIFSPSQHSSPARLAALAAAAAAHAARIPVTLLYARSQNNNHLLIEAAALVTAGLALPGHPDAGRWLKTGRQWLSWCFTRQIDVTGEYVQHSTNYQRLMLQTALWVNALASAELAPHKKYPDDDTARNVHDKLALATCWLVSRLDPQSGRVPNLGANDGALIFPFTTCDFADYRPVVQAAARAFLRAATARSITSGVGDEMSLWFGLPRTDETHTRAHRYQAGGQIYAINSWASLRAVQYSSRPSHADQLHCDLWWRGLNIAQDAGTYRYNADPPWDNRLTSTLVHNTVSVNGEEQMTRVGRFLYLDWAGAAFGVPSAVLARDKEHSEGGAEPRYAQRVSAQTEAYARLHVRHERTLTVFKDERWLVEDELINTAIPGREKLAPIYRLHWLLPDWEWSLEYLDARAALSIRSPHGWVSLTISTTQPMKRVSLLRAGELVYGDGLVSPVFGWSSPTYNVKKPALSLAVEVQSSQSVTFTSEFLFPSMSPPQIPFTA